jgi:hypothetical protein
MTAPDDARRYNGACTYPRTERPVRPGYEVRVRARDCAGLREDARATVVERRRGRYGWRAAVRLGVDPGPDAGTRMVPVGAVEPVRASEPVATADSSRVSADGGRA